MTYHIINLRYVVKISVQYSFDKEEYLNSGEIEKEIEVLRELRVLFRRIFGQEEIILVTYLKYR